MNAGAVWARTKKGFGKVYHGIPPMWRDIVMALLVIGILMGALWLFTGQPLSQAPLVVVESGSMMHLDPPYGRIGTIDPGDLILVKDAPGGRDEIVTLYGGRSATTDAHPGEGDREGYGLPGDVVIYQQQFCPDGHATPIIHRAVTWVQVEQVGNQRVFSYHGPNGDWLSRQPDVHLPEISIEHMEFDHSGWITKGDNPDTNQPADQDHICAGTLIKPEWLVGKARGEIPWIGLLKFIVQGNNWETDGTEGVCQVANARAPCDSFTMLWITLGIVVVVPLAWDLVLRARRSDDDEPPGPGGDDGSGSLADAPKGHAPKTGEKPDWVEAAEDDAKRRH